MSSLEDARTRYLAERPKYAEIAHGVASMLSVELRKEGILCRVDHRAKECHSLLLKLMNKGKLYDDIRDKAGVRIVLAYPDDRKAAAAIVKRTLSVLNEEDFRSPSDPKTFDYSGWHFDVTVATKETSHVCEVQLHTPGESLWAALAHDLIYKDESAPYVQRRDAHRLRALTELFDLEAERLRIGLREQDMADEREIYRTLLKYYLPLVPQVGRPELSLELLGDLKRALGPSDLPRLDGEIATFVARHGEKLALVFAGRSDRSEPFLYQPESILMFWLLERDPTSLAEYWPPGLPGRTPKAFAAMWGVPSHDPDSLD